MGFKATAIANDLNCCVPFTPVQFVKTSSTPGTPVALTAARTYFRQAILIGVKALAGTANVGVVKLGFSSAASAQPIVIQSEATYVLEPPQGGKWNFLDLYLDVANSGDGVTVIYC